MRGPGTGAPQVWIHNRILCGVLLMQDLLREGKDLKCDKDLQFLYFLANYECTTILYPFIPTETHVDSKGANKVTLYNDMVR